MPIDNERAALLELLSRIELRMLDIDEELSRRPGREKRLALLEEKARLEAKRQEILRRLEEINGNPGSIQPPDPDLFERIAKETGNVDVATARAAQAAAGTQLTNRLLSLAEELLA